MRTMRNQRRDKLLFIENDEIDIDFIESTLKHKNRVKKRWFPPRRKLTVENKIIGTQPNDWYGYRGPSGIDFDWYNLHHIDPIWVWKKVISVFVLWYSIWLVTTRSKHPKMLYPYRRGRQSTLEVYSIVPYLQNKLVRTYNKQKPLHHHDMVDLSSQLNRIIVQEQHRINRLDSDVNTRWPT